MDMSEEEIEHLIDLYYYFRQKQSPSQYTIRDLVSGILLPTPWFGASGPLFNLRPHIDDGALITFRRISPKYVLESYAKGHNYLIRRTI